MTLKQLFVQMGYDLRLDLVAGEKGLDKKIISVAEVNRPGLALCGYFYSFAYDRIQVLGAGEIEYLESISSEERRRIFQKMLSYDIPCFVVTRGLVVPKELIEECERTDTPLFRTDLVTPAFLGRLEPQLEDELGPSEVVSGDLVEVSGVGVLIIGESGIGKSECALELIRRGHRLVADDVVLIKRVPGHRLIGSNVYPFGHFMEVRGVGIIDVAVLFGITAVRPKKSIDMVAILERWDESKDYERLGLEQKTYTILEEELPYVLIPVQPGRNTAIIVEVAAMNLRAKQMGKFAAKEFSEFINEKMRKRIYDEVGLEKRPKS